MGVLMSYIMPRPPGEHLNEDNRIFDDAWRDAWHDAGHGAQQASTHDVTHGIAPGIYTDTGEKTATWQSCIPYTSAEEICLTTRVQQRNRLKQLGITMGKDDDYYVLRKHAITCDATMDEKFIDLECLADEDIVVPEDDPEFENFDIPHCCICLYRMRFVGIIAEMPCGHSICQECMLQMAKVLHRRKQRLACPLCRREFRHPQGLQQNLNKLLENAT